jgi:predicted pyridoxine 5'-phosphate oxidase superfamily flavin-nucleotide-binding protein
MSDSDRRFISDVAFTPAVKRVQERLGSRRGYDHMARSHDWAKAITPDIAAFIGLRDSFYLGTASADGRPYIQHRGGPPGFLKVIDDTTLAFADFSGNRQYITAGNLSENDRAYIFLMDYEQQRRVKIWGRAEVVEGDAELTVRVMPEVYDAAAERVIVFRVEAWDVNCPQHIPRKIDADQAEERIAALTGRIASLEQENERLRADGS